MAANLAADFLWYAAAMPLMSFLPDEPSASIIKNRRRAPFAAGDHNGTYSFAVVAIANPPNSFRVTPSGFPLGNAHGGSW